MIELLCQTQRKTQFSITIHDSLEEIKNEWNYILPENHHLKSKYLLFLEKSTTSKAKYGIAKKNNKIVGVLYLQITEFTEKDVNFSTLKFTPLSCILKSIFYLSCQFLVLICGNLYRTAQEGYYFNKDIEPKLVFEELSEQFQKIDRNLSGIIIKESKEIFHKNEKGKFSEIGDDITMKIDINPQWTSIDDYINELSKKYRKRYQKIKESSKNLIKKELNEEEITFYELKIFNLYQQIVKNQSLKIGGLLPNYFVEMKKALGENFKIFGIFNEDKLIAFSSHIYRPNKQKDIHYIGLEYSLNDNFNLYFNLLYWGLELAIYDKQVTLELGRTAHLAKASMGALPVEQHNYVFLKSGIIKLSFWVYSKSILKKIDTEWKNRSPFNTKNELKII